MQRRDGGLVFPPSDLTDFLECEHLSALELAVARGGLARLVRDNPQGELIRRKGEEHEAAHLEQLRAEGREIAHLVRVAKIRRDQIKRLAASGIATLEALAAAYHQRTLTCTVLNLDELDGFRERWLDKRRRDSTS